VLEQLKQLSERLHEMEETFHYHASVTFEAVVDTKLAERREELNEATAQALQRARVEAVEGYAQRSQVLVDEIGSKVEVQANKTAELLRASDQRAETERQLETDIADLKSQNQKVKCCFLNLDLLKLISSPPSSSNRLKI